MSRGSRSFSDSAARSASRRTREVARAALLAYLALSVAGCAYPRLAQGRVLFTYDEFRDRLGRLVAGDNLSGAVTLLKETEPARLARTASEQSDIRYMFVAGATPPVPGVDPFPRPARKWTVPVARDGAEPVIARKFQLTALQFAAAFNQALAAEEKGVR